MGKRAVTSCKVKLDVTGALGSAACNLRFEVFEPLGMRTSTRLGAPVTGFLIGSELVSKTPEILSTRSGHGNRIQTQSVQILAPFSGHYMKQ
jgi:hypothetical protein